MIYSEASFFDGYYFQHIADWKEYKRLKRIKDNLSKITKR